MGEHSFNRFRFLTFSSLCDNIIVKNPENLRGTVCDYNNRLLAVAKSKNLTIKKIDELLKDGADINYVDELNDSILHHVVNNSKATLEVIQFLLVSRAFPDARNINNWPPLAYCKPFSIAKLLIQYTVMTKLHENISDENSNFNNEYLISGESETILDLQFLINIDKHKHSFFKNYRDSCIAEMKTMKEDVITEDCTLFDFITRNYFKDDKKIEKFAIVEIVSRLLNKKYPSCRDIIYATVGDCDGIALTSSFNVQMYSVAANPAKKVIFLNAECTAEIEKNLTTEDTVSLIQALGHKDIFKSMLCSLKRWREESKQSSVKK